MSQKRPVPLGKKPPAAADTFVKTEIHPNDGDGSEIAKTFRISASLSRRLKIYAAHSGQKERTSWPRHSRSTWKAQAHSRRPPDRSLGPTAVRKETKS